MEILCLQSDGPVFQITILYPRYCKSLENRMKGCTDVLQKMASGMQPHRTSTLLFFVSQTRSHSQVLVAVFQLFSLFNSKRKDYIFEQSMYSSGIGSSYLLHQSIDIYYLNYVFMYFVIKTKHQSILHNVLEMWLKFFFFDFKSRRRTSVQNKKKIFGMEGSKI